MLFGHTNAVFASGGNCSVSWISVFIDYFVVILTLQEDHWKNDMDDACCQQVKFSACWKRIMPGIRRVGESHFLQLLAVQDG